MKTTKSTSMALRLIGGAMVIEIGTPAAAAQSDVDMQALVARTKPGAGQAELKPLLGRWRVVKANYLLGTDKPLMSERMTTVRTMIGDGRFVSDMTTGLLGGKPYFRVATLG